MLGFFHAEWCYQDPSIYTQHVLVPLSFRIYVTFYSVARPHFVYPAASWGHLMLFAAVNATLDHDRKMCVWLFAVLLVVHWGVMARESDGPCNLFLSNLSCFFLPLPFQCWDYRGVSPNQAAIVAFNPLKDCPTVFQNGYHFIISPMIGEVPKFSVCSPFFSCPPNPHAGAPTLSFVHVG